MHNYRLAKRPDSPRWYIVWTEGRRSFRRPTGTEDRAQAELVLAAFRLEVERPPEVKQDELEISKILDWYYEEHAAKRPSADQAKIAIKRFKAFYGASRIPAINSTTHVQYEKQRRDAGVKHETINRERMVLRAALNHARRHHGFLNVPHIPAIPPDHPDNQASEPKGRPLSIREMSKLCEAAKSDHIRRFILILIGTMCRPDAARDLQIKGQLDFEHSLIHLNPPGRRQTKKHRPIVPMPKFLRKELKGLKGKYVVEYHGGKIASTKTAWRALREAAGLGEDVNPYSIRHTMSRELRRRGVPSEQISIMLGHRPQNVSRMDLIYAPFEPGYCAQAAKAIDSIYADIARHWRADKGAEKQRKKR